MLLVTHAGLTVNLAHVAYIHVRTEEADPDPPVRPRAPKPHLRVLLALSNGDSVVAARDLPPAAGRFLREAVTHAWAEGTALTDVRDLLGRYEEGAYIAASAAEMAVTAATEEAQPDT